MQSRYVASPEASSFSGLVDAFASAHPELTVIFAAIAEGAPVPPDAVVAAARASSVPLAAAVFPRVIHGPTSDDRGVVLLGWAGASDLAVLQGLSGPIGELAPRIEAASGTWPTPPGARESLLVVVDGLAAHLSDLLFELYAGFGERFAYFGGGAGSLTLEQRPVIFTRDGAFADAALLIRLEGRPQVGVTHGWARFRGPFVASSVDGRVLLQLDWEPAFDVYQRALASGGRRVERAGFWDVAREHPLGIERPSGEVIVRDPIAVTEEGGIVCVGEIPENSVLHVLGGEPTALISAARDAARAAVSDASPSGRVVVVADCISRAVFLGADLENELRAIRDIAGEGAEVVGAMTLGEIASPAGTFLEFLNKSTVVASFDGPVR